MISQLKEMVRGSRVESLARRIYKRLERVYGVLGKGAYELGDLNEIYDRQTVKIMERVLSGNSNCIDVGCHKGLVLTEILRLAPGGTHFAFEPIPYLFEDLRRNYPGVQVHEMALSDASGTSAFHYVVSNPGYSGLKQRHYDRPNETLELLQVRTERLDDVLGENARVDFIKVDVEGAELQVFNGGITTIKRNRPVIVFEHGLGAADCYGTRPEQVYDCLSSRCGLKISTLSSWLDGGSPLTRREFKRQFRRAINFYFVAHP